MELTPLQKQELNKLVDKYENRRDYTLEEKSPRRTMLTLDGKKYPDYYHVSDSRFRLAFNRDMEDLKARGLVELEWVPFNRGDELKRIVLREEALPALYEALGRKSRRAEYRKLEEVFTDWRAKAPSELEPFFAAMLPRIRRLLPLPSRIRLEGISDYQDLFKGLEAFFAPRKQEILKRQLSVSLYRDSKRWEELEKSILWVVKTFGLGKGQEDLEEEDLLSEYNILETPRHINLAGPLVFSTPRGRVSLSAFHPDLGLSPVMVQELAVEACGARAVVTVENLTSFYQYVYRGPGDHLVIYLGGYHNRPRRLILTKIRDYFAGKGRVPPFYHWGDMDLGGFRIWHHLCRSTGIAVKPLFMDEKTYLAHLSRGQAMDETYAGKLAELEKDPAYAPLHTLIRRMLEKGVRVEQEAVEPDGVEYCCSAPFTGTTATS